MPSGVTDVGNRVSRVAGNPDFAFQLFAGQIGKNKLVLIYSKKARGDCDIHGLTHHLNRRHVFIRVFLHLVS
jgi:hypothetical protein